MGKTIFIFGLIITLIGAVMWLFGDKMGFLGKLPGDIQIKRENFAFYMPLTTMIVVSVILSALAWIVQKFLK